MSHENVLAVAEELIKACAGFTVAKGKHDLRRPDVLVLAPRCSDDPEFLTRLEHGCVARDKNVKMLVNSGQIRFGGVGEWTGSQCPLVVLTGFHQPYHLLNNVGCIGPERILAASSVEVDRGKILAKAAQPNDRPWSRDNVRKPAMKVVAKAKELEETHAHLLTKISKVPVDTLLYIAITRATWGIIVVEPDARRFVQHYVVGKEGRARSRAGEEFMVKTSLDTSDGDRDVQERRSIRRMHARRFAQHYVLGKNGRWVVNTEVNSVVKPSWNSFEPRIMHRSQVLLERREETQAHYMNMSGKDLSLVPDSVLDMDDTHCLDLSVNNLQRLPKGLWSLPLRELNLSHNRALGRALLLILKEAASCTGLEKLWLRDVSEEGAQSMFRCRERI